MFLQILSQSHQSVTPVSFVCHHRRQRQCCSKQCWRAKTRCAFKTSGKWTTQQEGQGKTALISLKEFFLERTPERWRSSVQKRTRGGECAQRGGTILSALSNVHSRTQALDDGGGIEESASSSNSRRGCRLRVISCLLLLLWSPNLGHTTTHNSIRTAHCAATNCYFGEPPCIISQTPFFARPVMNTAALRLKCDDHPELLVNLEPMFYFTYYPHLLIFEGQIGPQYTIQQGASVKP